MLAAQLDLKNGDFGIIGIVKETGVDDEGLVQFYNDYFKYPLYCDKAYSFYQALGDRKVGVQIAFNPLALVDLVCNAYSRLTSKGVEGNFVGEGFTQGGVIFFDAAGKPKYAYEEQTGQDVPIGDIVTVVNAMRREAETASST